MTLTTLKNTNQETIIHFASSTNETGTITIANLTASTQARNADTPVVDIVKYHITGELGSHVRIQRNSKTVISCSPENAPYAEFNAWGIPVNNDNTYDIVIDLGSGTEVFEQPILNNNAVVVFGVEKRVTTNFQQLLCPFLQLVSEIVLSFQTVLQFSTYFRFFLYFFYWVGSFLTSF